MRRLPNDCHSMPMPGSRFMKTCALTFNRSLNYKYDMDAVFRAIADPTRRRILDHLARREDSVLELAKDFDISLPAVSQHLKVLRRAELVQAERHGRQIVYRLNAPPLRGVALWIDSYERFWRIHLKALGAHLRKKHG
jgi:DNA-binding transcriptional ArsR family regulator